MTPDELTLEGTGGPQVPGDRTDGVTDDAVTALVVRACAALHDPDGDPQLEAVKAALLLEDALGVVLTDADLEAIAAAPGDAGTLLALVGAAERAT